MSSADVQIAAGTAAQILADAAAAPLRDRPSADDAEIRVIAAREGCSLLCAALQFHNRVRQGELAL